MANRSRLIIRGLSLISALGASTNGCSKIWERGFGLSRAPYRPIDQSAKSAPVFPLNDEAEAIVQQVANDDRYHRLDRTTQLCLAAARSTLAFLNDSENPGPLGCISIGSSRGPTMALEHSFEQFSRDGRVAPLTSPVTTAGNLSSWVAQEYLSGLSWQGELPPIAALSTSMTCSSALHSLLVAMGFVGSGMASTALFGGAEACLTPYTVAQLEALRIYASLTDAELSIANSWPCRPMDFIRGENSVVLGEGAGTALLIKSEDESDRMPGDLEVLGVGWALEAIPSPTGISLDGAAFEQAIGMALKAAGIKPAPQTDLGLKIGAAVLHAPGSRIGDEAEFGAVRRLLGDIMLCSTKHLTGHAYGASGMLSLGLASGLLNGLKWRGFPYAPQELMPSSLDGCQLAPGSAVLINSAGFGGNAIALIVTGCN